MSSPEILIDLEKIRSNTRVIVNHCRARGISVTGVTKVTCGMPLVARAMLEGGVAAIGESRLENIRRMRVSGINAPMMMLRIPPLSQVAEIVANTDISLNSELPVIRSLSEAAVKKGKIHKIVLMIDLGDLREGIWPSELMDFAREVVELPGVKIVGVGTNLTCFGGVLPSRENMTELVRHAEKMEDAFSLQLDILSGGNSSALPLLMEGGIPPRINHLRIGEAILLGRETAHGTLWPGCADDAFQLAAEVIELKQKPSVPIGETGMDAFGNKPVFPDKGEILRGILSVGREDVIIDKLKPRQEGISILGASSDHLLLDVTKADKRPVLGEKLLFSLEYGALLAGMTSQYVKKTPFTGEKPENPPKEIVMIGRSPLFSDENLLRHLEDLGFAHKVAPEEISEENISAIVRNNQFPFIGGELNKTAISLKGIVRIYDQMGLIIFSPFASLQPDEKSNEDHNFLAKIFGIHSSDWDLSPHISPESTVIIGLREADKREVEIIKQKGILAYTMEDVDLLGMREIMISSLRRVTTGTEGFYTRISTDVINAEGEGLTFREVHLAMEMAADTAGMIGFDISGTPDRSWIDDRTLRSIVESAFGKRILKL